MWNNKGVSRDVPDLYLRVNHLRMNESAGINNYREGKKC